MTMFFLDLWHDLREKRLWPVAVGLLAAIIAVPVILFKPASDAAPPPTVTPKTGGADTLPVVEVQTGPSVGSRLEAYSARNPFKPMKDLAKTTDGSSASGGSGSGTGSGSGSGSGNGSTLANPNGTSSGGGSSSSGGGSSSGGSTPSSGGTPSSPAAPVRWFRYTANFSFGTPGKLTTFKNKASFTLLPDDKTPSIVFIGIDADHKHAMFFISDPAIQAQGEGTCNAKGAECRFVTLSRAESGDEETFTAIDGSTSYDLKLLKINREELNADSSGNPVIPKNGKTQVATGAGVATATQATQSVIPAMFAAGPGVVAQQK